MPLESAVSGSLIAACVIMLASLSGVVFSIAVLRHVMQRSLPYLATFAGGVFVVVIIHLIEEMLHEADSVVLAFGAVLLGAALMEILHHILPAHHHHEVAHDHAHTPIDGRRVLISDALHNVGDGVLLVAAFTASSVVGIAAAIGVFLHELVQEVSEFFILKESGYSTRKALLLNLLSGSTILIGIALAVFLSSSLQILALFSGLAAGGFIAVIVRDLVPHALASGKVRGFGYHTLALFLGIALMYSVQVLVPHAEEEHDLHDNVALTK